MTTTDYHRPSEIFTRIYVAYDILLTASCLNPMPDQEGAFLAPEVCDLLHRSVDDLKELLDKVEAVVKGTEG